jgi:hypothetical protein
MKIRIPTVTYMVVYIIMLGLCQLALVAGVLVFMAMLAIFIFGQKMVGIIAVPLDLAKIICAKILMAFLCCQVAAIIHQVRGLMPAITLAFG